MTRAPAGFGGLALTVLLGGALSPAAAQEACLSTVRPVVTERGAEACRFQGAVANACGRDVRYVVVRARPHPVRGPLPTVSDTIARFGLGALSFEREWCEQDIRVLELAPDGTSLDATERAMVPPIALPAVETRAREIATCVASCPRPVADRASILSELRRRYAHALDDAAGENARDTLVAALQGERQTRERLCADVCHGRLPAEALASALAEIERRREAATASAAAALATIAARPPRLAVPFAPLPEADERVADGLDGAGAPGGDRNLPTSAALGAAIFGGATRTCVRLPNGRSRCTMTIPLGAESAGQRAAPRRAAPRRAAPRRAPRRSQRGADLGILRLPVALLAREPAPFLPPLGVLALAGPVPPLAPPGAIG